MLQPKFCVLTTNFFISVMSVLSLHIDTKHSIVYEDVMSNRSRATYFGYSVVIHTGKEHWIQIGAPRGNSSHDRSVREPGIVYQCQVGETCGEVNLSGTANEKNPQKESRVNAWIGASMTAINGKKDESVVVCGHRRRDISYPKSNIMTGSCYIIPVGKRETQEQCKLVPLNDTRYYTKTVKFGSRTVRISNTALGQAGISAHYPKKNGHHELLLGAPGILNWQGATISYNISQEKRCGAYSSHIRGPDLNTEPVYFGYAVSAGNLFPDKGLVYAVGAPRASQGSGMVLLYDYSAKYHIAPIIEITGTQLGEYFGASIATADINKDGYDDMIIGAPRYSTTSIPDQGRIYISLGGEIINKEMEHIDGGIRNAQFGTTVAAVGDINNDGFEDIAVGAPYSNDYRGTVYIYIGGKNGLSLAQVIDAAQISSSLRGFGISIHHTVETCERDKAYMAIGAYLSGHVAVLRSYPDISLHVQLNSSIKTIEKSNHQFLLTVCSWYDAACGPSEISVTRNIFLDTEYYRIHIQDENGKKNLHEEEIILQNGQRSCNTFDVFIHEDKGNTEYSIVIEASQTLNNYEQAQTTLLIKTNGMKTGIDTFCRNCSIVNWKTSKLSDTLKLPFSDCGDDEICNSELHLQCTFLDIVNGTFVIGSSSELKLLFGFTNKKEPAYQTILHVQIPEPVKRLRLHKDCYETVSLMETVLHCNLKSPLDYNDEDELIVEVDMSHLVEKDLLSVTFNAWLTTASLNNGSSDRCSLDLKLKATADIYIIGKSAKEVVSYSSGTDAVFEQTYQVYKVGDSPVRKAGITVNVPYLLWMSDGEKREFLKIIQFEVTQGRYVIQCESDPPLPTSSYNDIIPEIQEINSIEMDQSRPKREVTKTIKLPEVNSDDSVSSTDNTLYLNCTREDVVCQNITCTSGFTDSKALLTIKFIGKLNTSALGNIMKKKNIILLSTNGSVDVKEPKNLIRSDTDRMDTALVTISFVLEISEKKVEEWVIGVSAICGIFVLLLIIIVLMKAGFFRREKKEALEKLVAATIAEDFYYEKKTDAIPSQQLTETNGSAEEIFESN
ncbi:integrin alpha-4-like [Schistocerca americana]|uniref:integrin alpha-4-like n=1 Tax=Schistocerca americana TaxID=7009 RepID=UPI001F4FE94B|nr:integrin alpha-4-like [Schistocerca americana]